MNVKKYNNFVNEKKTGPLNEAVGQEVIYSEGGRKFIKFETTVNTYYRKSEQLRKDLRKAEDELEAFWDSSLDRKVWDAIGDDARDGGSAIQVVAAENNKVRLQYRRFIEPNKSADHFEIRDALEELGIESSSPKLKA